MRKNNKTKIQKSIKRRWIFGSLFITFVILIIAESIFAFYTINSFYTSTRQAMKSRIATIEGQLKTKENAPPQERSLSLALMLEEFLEKDKFEFMIIGEQGKVISSSSGFTTKVEHKAEYQQAQKSQNLQADTVYYLETGEKVMAVTCLIPNLADDAKGVRFVTSLTNIDNQIIINISLSLLFVMVVFAFSVVSGVYFIKSIVTPIGDIEKITADISHGNFEARLTSKYDDEIGRLCNSINSMAQELAKTENLKNEFISSVSHELRTPLTSIKGWIETLSRVNDPHDENYKKGMEIVRCETDRLYTMVEELLDFSRIENTGLKIELTKLDLVAEVTDVSLIIEKRAEIEGVVLDYTEPENVIIISGDSNRLRQVFVNILDNAFKYSSRGCTIKIEILTDEENAYVKIIDQGSGISQDEIQKVKQKFYKGRGAVRGSGIGLAVVEEILHAHSGDFTIESQKGIGTCVTIQLPLFKNNM